MKTFLPYVPLLTLGLMGGAHAQSVSAQSIIVNPAPTALKVGVHTNRDGSGQGVPAYGLRDRLELHIRASQDAYVYLFNVDPAGRVGLLVPGTPQGAGNFVKANTTLRLPPKGVPSPFIRAGSLGVNKVFVLASLVPLDLGKLPVAGKGFGGFTAVNVRGEAGLGQALGVLTAPLKPESWTTNAARYQIAEAGFAGTSYRSVFESRGSLRDIYTEFSDRLRAEGHGQITVRWGKNDVYGVFGRDAGPQRNAILEIRQRGRTFEVKLIRK